jgi:hypothetical protein
MTSAIQFQAMVEKAGLNMDRLDRIVNGDASTAVSVDNAIVLSMAALAAQLVAKTLIFNPRGPWQSNTPYSVRDLVVANGLIYVAVQDFISGGSIGADIAAGKVALYQTDLVSQGTSKLVDASTGFAGSQQTSLQDFVTSSEIDIWQALTLAMRADAIGGGLSVDISPAINAILGSATSHSIDNNSNISGPTIKFRNYRYFVGSTINLKRTTRLLGEGSGMPWQGTATLVFPAGVTGIILNRIDTMGAGLENPTTAGADGSIIEGLNLHGAKGNADAAGGPGIWMRARGLIRNTLISSFQGDGARVFATAGGASNVQGNANNWRIEGGRFQGNGGNGLSVGGAPGSADVNAGTCVGLDCSGNAGWAFYDGSFLGNTYMGCHAADNQTGAYHTDNNNACNVLLGCYSEGGQPPSDLAYPTIVMGGQHAAGIKGTAAWLNNYQGQLVAMYQSAQGAKPAKFGIVDQSTGMGIRFDADPNAYGWAMDVADGSTQHTYGLETSGNDFRFTRDHGDTPVAAVWTRTNTTKHCGGDRFAFPNGYGNGPGYAKVEYGYAPPTSGSYKSMDRVENLGPLPGGFIGWVCTADGTPGTWKGYGLIAT